MAEDFDFDPLVRLLFHQAGWSADYRYDISAWSAALTAAGYPLWDAARRLLTRIGGVSIDSRPYCKKPFWVDDGDERYECILALGRTPGPLIFNPLHPMALAHREDLYRLHTLQDTNWEMVPIGSFRTSQVQTVEYVLFLLSTGEFVKWPVWHNPLVFCLAPIGRTFPAAMRNLFHYNAWFRGIMP